MSSKRSKRIEAYSGWVYTPGIGLHSPEPATKPYQPPKRRRPQPRFMRAKALIKCPPVNR